MRGPGTRAPGPRGQQVGEKLLRRFSRPEPRRLDTGGGNDAGSSATATAASPVHMRWRSPEDWGGRSAKPQGVTRCRRGLRRVEGHVQGDRRPDPAPGTKGPGGGGGAAALPRTPPAQTAGASPRRAPENAGRLPCSGLCFRFRTSFCKRTCAKTGAGASTLRRNARC